MSTSKPLEGQLEAEDWLKLAEGLGQLSGPPGPAVRMPRRVHKPKPAGGRKPRRANPDKVTDKRRARAKMAKASRRRNRR